MSVVVCGQTWTYAAIGRAELEEVINEADRGGEMDAIVGSS